MSCLLASSRCWSMPANISSVAVYSASRTLSYAVLYRVFLSPPSSPARAVAHAAAPSSEVKVTDGLDYGSLNIGILSSHG